MSVFLSTILVQKVALQCRNRPKVWEGFCDPGRRWDGRASKCFVDLQKSFDTVVVNDNT